MSPLTYLGFTIFSIIMQFSVMELIHERFQLDRESASFNETIDKNSELIQDVNRKPHALFYRTEANDINFETDNDPDSTKYSNTLDDVLLTSTDSSSTTYEVFYENTSIIDDFFTTESYSTGSEFDNVTEITLLDKHNVTTGKPSVNKKVINKKCFCNLLYQKCDVNCCCDTDCTEEERQLFINCLRDDCGEAKKNEIYFCNRYPICRNTFSTDVINDLFCVAAVNLPKKRIKSHFQLDIAALNATFKWKSIQKSDIPLQYKKKKYEYGEPLWLFKNGVISSLSLPTTVTNYYCSGKKQLFFLENENIQCKVKIKDLYMFSALKALEGTKLISVTELTTNATVLNCSTLHCINWTILACDEYTCSDYNKTMHAPFCTDNYCNNLAHALDYTFYYFESKIINATFRLYLTKVPMSMPLIMQSVTVKWYLGNESIDNVVQLSGNPGYISGLPLIFSLATENRTKNFYNQSYGRNILTLPSNVNGRCNWLRGNNKSLVFGLNTRLKCRLNIMQNIFLKNATRSCQAIQMYIKERLGLDKMLFISPLGNPYDVSDDKWIPLEIYDRTFFYGEYRSKNSKLECYNLATRYAFVIAYADTSGAEDKVENKIIKASVGVTYLNVTFNLAEISTVLTVDIRFIDISRPIVEFARAPDLNMHLPANFFFDHSSNDCYYHTGNIVFVVYSCLIILLW